MISGAMAGRITAVGSLWKWVFRNSRSASTSISTLIVTVLPMAGSKVTEPFLTAVALASNVVPVVDFQRWNSVGSAPAIRAVNK